MLSCLGGCGAYSESRSLAACEILRLFFDVVFFQPRLSFRRNEDEEGVEGSSELEISVGVSIFCGFVNFCGARGPLSRAGRFSMVLSRVTKSPLVLDLGIYMCSPPCFGSDEERYGETACLGVRPVIGIGFGDSELLPPNCEDDSDLR